MTINKEIKIYQKYVKKGKGGNFPFYIGKGCNIFLSLEENLVPKQIKEIVKNCKKRRNQ